MMNTMDQRELHDDDEDSASSREFAELDSEIRRMSLHADSILQSIQEVSGDADSHLLQQLSPHNHLTNSIQTAVGRRAPTRKPQAYLSYEDDDMTEEEERLEFIAKSIRESLAESNMDVPIMQTASYSTSTYGGANLAEKSDEVEQSSEILLLGCTIVCAMVMILFVHAQYFLLNAKGHIQLPFSL